MARQFEYKQTEAGEIVEIAVRGRQILARPMIAFGTAYTHEERDQLGLNGLLPPAVVSMSNQLKRLYKQFKRQPNNLAKYVLLTDLQERNEILFYRLVTEHLEEMLPIIYTPTIGEAIREYSAWYTRPRGVFLGIDQQDDMELALRNYGQGPDDVDLIVVTDSEGILGIGDQGIGGIRIAIGKLAVYTAAAGIHPLRVMPIVLDPGTDNMALLNDDGYLGLRHPRVRGEAYDEFVEKFVTTAARLYPRALIHWEDLGASNAHRVLAKYVNDYRTFNDDIQGTAAVVAAAVLAAVQASGTRMADQRVVIHGSGSAGIGIADLLVEIMVAHGMDPDQARACFWGLGSRGLLREGTRMRDFQEPYARSQAELDGWQLDEPDRYVLADVVRNVKPTILIGTSAQPGAFNEAIVKDMAAHVERPIILPLSNPTSQSEALPADLLAWTGGKALIATGSPFAPVERDEQTYTIAQANNALVFPGIGLGTIVSQASRVTPGMISAAAQALAGLADGRRLGSAILPAASELRSVSATVAIAVAEAAVADGVAEVELDSPIQQVYKKMWQPSYPTVVPITNSVTPVRRADGSIDDGPDSWHAAGGHEI